MRVVKAKIEVNPWNGAVGAKAELQQAWFRVRGIPYDKKSEETLAYAGSLVGATVGVDKASLHRSDYGKVKIAARDITKVHVDAEGAIIPFLYDFLYEREVLMEPNVEGNTVVVQVNQPGPTQPSPKNLKTMEQASGQGQLQSEDSANQEQGEKQKGKQGLESLSKNHCWF
jgi:hypothetical protein